MGTRCLSDCPPLLARLNWYGAYDFTQAPCFLGPEGGCNQANTVKCLQQLAEWLGPLATLVLIIWDGAPWHKARLVQEPAAAIGLCLQPLPAYSPDLNRLRAEVTHHHCHLTLRTLFDACQSFIQRMNAVPDPLLACLWPKFELDPDFEKLLRSN